MPKVAAASAPPRSTFDLLIPSGGRSSGEACMVGGGGRDFLSGGRAAALEPSAAGDLPMGARGA